jgi:hypothetical protein
MHQGFTIMATIGFHGTDRSSRRSHARVAAVSAGAAFPTALLSPRLRVQPWSFAVTRTTCGGGSASIQAKTP